jgi:cytochrome b561
LPDTAPSLQRLAAKASHVVLYALMLILPLVGWGMLSAARYPIVLYGPARLPPILQHDLTLYAWLRELHTVLTYLLFAAFLAHFGAALYHGLIRRDGVFGSMASLELGSMQRARTNPASIPNSTQTPDS